MGKNRKKINIKFYSRGASKRVTGSNHFIEIRVNNTVTNIMLDCGAIQDSKLTTKQLFDANKLKYDLGDIDFALISHSHYDHIMNLCQLQQVNFVGDIYMTDLTLQIAEHITADGLKIHNSTAGFLTKSNGKKHEKIHPYMNERTRQYFLERVKAYGFEEWITLTDNIRFKFIGAGHVSGASMIYIEVRDGYEVETVLYTGDTSCNRDIPFTKRPNVKDLKVTHLITESTYGGQVIPQRKESDITDKLYKLIKHTCLEKRGDLLIPSFSFARSTNMAYYLKKTYEKYPEISHVPIFMISPLMKKCHDSISINPDCFDEKWKKEMDLFEWKKIKMIHERKDIVNVGKTSNPSVMLSASGMGDMGVNSFLLPYKIKDSQNTVCFVGYCAEGTMGHNLLIGEQKEVTTIGDGKERKIKVRAEINNITGLSSHACGYEIIEMIKTANTNKFKNVIVVHGDEDRSNLLAEDFLKSFKKIKAYVPREGQEIKL